ncbi:unnamed protein product, partial [Owenia fusiformis]
MAEMSQKLERTPEIRGQENSKLTEMMMTGSRGKREQEEAVRTTPPVDKFQLESTVLFKGDGLAPYVHAGDDTIPLDPDDPRAERTPERRFQQLPTERQMRMHPGLEGTTGYWSSTQLQRDVRTPPGLGREFGEGARLRHRGQYPLTSTLIPERQKDEQILLERQLDSTQSQVMAIQGSLGTLRSDVGRRLQVQSEEMVSLHVELGKLANVVNQGQEEAKKSREGMEAFLKEMNATLGQMSQAPPPVSRMVNPSRVEMVGDPRS